jgi:hypothetical protein
MSILKRQRELKKSEKAARKRAKRHGASEPLFQEPRPTVHLDEPFDESDESVGEDKLARPGDGSDRPGKD